LPFGAEAAGCGEAGEAGADDDGFVDHGLRRGNCRPARLCRRVAAGKRGARACVAGRGGLARAQ
jgi:hypothetical protein